MITSPDIQKLEAYLKAWRGTSGDVGLVPLLPLIFELKGSPYDVAKGHFPFLPSFDLRQPRKSIWKTGRQVSKCCHHSTAVTMADGSLRTVAEIRAGDRVACVTKEFHSATQEVLEVFDNGVADCVEVRTKGGAQLVVTPNHRLRTPCGYTEAGDLKLGDALASVQRSGKFGSAVPFGGPAGVWWDTVVSVTPVGQHHVYDIEVAEEHNFLIDTGIVSHNSTTKAYQGVIHSIAIPNFNTVYITPFQEQIRKFSTNYVKPAIDSCLLRGYIREKYYRGQDSVMQRSMPHNGSNMFFSFASNNVERIRGIAADKISVDETQGIDRQFLFVIGETMSASEYRIVEFAGTPLSKANPMQLLWDQSSQGEWAIPCKACNKTNLMWEEAELLKCIGLNGLICAFCGKPINTEEGYWRHERDERRNSFVGRHAPQCIFPMHCRNGERWGEYLHKREVDHPKWMMECNGESQDVGTKLATVSDLKNASVLPWKNSWEQFINSTKTKGYALKILAADWSGGGSDEISLTALAGIGIHANLRAEVGWMKHYPHSTVWMDDARRVLTAFKQGGFDYLAHDFAGAGAGREQLLIAAGFPVDKIIPITYVHAPGQKALMTYNAPEANNVRSSYSLDKARSVVLICELIRQLWITFPQWESSREHLEDFLALVEETTKSPRGSDIYLINKSPGVPDDMAHAITMGMCAAFYRMQRWPDLGTILRKFQKTQLAEMNPDIGAARVLGSLE